jgi:beta-lactamase regulating signal transducer with metallopeptidase domain
MSRADQTFGALVIAVSALGFSLAMPFALTLFPALIDNVLRGTGDALHLCAGILNSVHPELPPLGAFALGLGVVALAPACVRIIRFVGAIRRRARPATVDAPGRLRRAVQTVGLGRRVVCLDDQLRYAYCAGLLVPRVYVSLGTVHALRGRELEAVLWHEGHHLRRRDPLRALLARAFAGIFVVAPVISELAERFEIASELEADRAVLRAQGTPRWIAGALLALGRTRPPSRHAPLSAWSLSSARVDQLEEVGADVVLPPISPLAVVRTAAVLAVALGLALGQAARAHFVELAFLPEATGAIAHLCPLPIAGPLL